MIHAVGGVDGNDYVVVVRFGRYKYVGRAYHAANQSLNVILKDLVGFVDADAAAAAAAAAAAIAANVNLLVVLVSASADIFFVAKRPTWL